MAALVYLAHGSVVAGETDADTLHGDGDVRADEHPETARPGSVSMGNQQPA